MKIVWRDNRDRINAVIALGFGCGHGAIIAIAALGRQLPARTAGFGALGI